MKRIALVGTAPSGKYAPFNDPSWELWGVGMRADYFRNAKRWYELHRLDGEPPQWAADWRALMKPWASECEIYMFYPEPDLGRVVQMDPKPLLAKYGAFFMTSSFSWMMAQAIEEGAQEIGLWGVDMEYGTEYRQQRVGLRHFIEIAKTAGIKVTRVASSGIAMEPIPYPFWQDDPILSKVHLRKATLKEQAMNAASVAKSLEEKLLRLEGAKEETKRLGLSDADLLSRFGKLEDETNAMRSSMVIARDDAQQAKGALDELNWLEDYLQP